MIFEALWLGSILLCAGLYLWSFAASRVPRRGRTAVPDRGAADSTKDEPR
ncbi:hypothetical protein ACFW16_32090 [Inquilinus sp. NPDC058860]